MSKYIRPFGIDLSRPLEEQPANFLVPEAAAWLRRTARTLANWEARGLIKVIRPAGGYPIIPRSEIERLMSEGA